MVQCNSGNVNFYEPEAICRCSHFLCGAVKVIDVYWMWKKGICVLDSAGFRRHFEGRLKITWTASMSYKILALHGVHSTLGNTCEPYLFPRWFMALVTHFIVLWFSENNISASDPFFVWIIFLSRDRRISLRNGMESKF